MTVFFVLLTHASVLISLALLVRVAYLRVFNAGSGEEVLMRSLAVLTGVIAYVTLRTLRLGLPARLVPTPDDRLSVLKLLFGVAAPAVAGTLLAKLALWRTRRLGAADVRLLLAAGAATFAMLLDIQVKAAVAAGLSSIRPLLPNMCFLLGGLGYLLVAYPLQGEARDA